MSIESIEAAVRLNNVAVDFNLRAFLLGRHWALDPRGLVAVAARDAKEKLALPRTLTKSLAHRIKHLKSYQGPALAQRYAALVERVRLAEAALAPDSQANRPRGGTHYAKVLAYKDEFEVARLLTQPSLQDELRQTFEAGGPHCFQLGASPGQWRGGEWPPEETRVWGVDPAPAAPAGQAAWAAWWRSGPVRNDRGARMERTLITEYEALVESVLTHLRRDNLEEFQRLLELIDEVRGFGPVKRAAVERYRARVAAALPLARA